MSLEQFRQLPRHEYILRGVSPPEGLLSIIESKIIEAPIRGLPPEVELPDGVEEEIAEIQTGLLDFTKERFGMDVSSRMPRRNQIHVFDADGFALVKKQANQNEKSEGFAIRQHIYLPFDNQNKAVFLHDLTHEHVHTIAGDLHSVRFKRLANGETSFKHKMLRSGYAVTSRPGHHSPYKAANEYVTEKVTKLTLGRIGMRDALKVPGYSQFMPTGDLILRRTARARGLTEEQTLDDLIAGQLESNLKALWPIYPALGSLAKEFVHVNVHGDALDAFAQKLS